MAEITPTLTAALIPATFMLEIAEGRMSDAAIRDLHTEITKLADELKIVDGTFVVAKKQAVTWRDRDRNWPAGDRKTLAVDLVVFARRLLQGAPEATQEAIYLISVMLAGLVGGEQQAHDLLEQGGVDLQKCAALLGTRAPDLSLVGAEAPAGAQSLLGFRGKKQGLCAGCAMISRRRASVCSRRQPRVPHRPQQISAPLPLGARRRADGGIAPLASCLCPPALPRCRDMLRSIGALVARCPVRCVLHRRKIGRAHV